MRLSPIVANFQAFTAEVLGKPLVRPKRLLDLLKTRPVYVKRVEEWACAQVPYELEDGLSAQLRRSRVYLQSLQSEHVTLMGKLDYHLFLRRQSRRRNETRTETRD
jgi:hypothetical protein